MAIMSDTKKFYIDWETADRIAAQNLLEQHEFLTVENAEINEMDEVPLHRLEDMAYNIKVLKAIKVLLGYYGVDTL
jgi:hypothetical protein